MGDSGNESFGSEGTASTLCLSPLLSPPTPVLELHLSPSPASSPQGPGPHSSPQEAGPHSSPIQLPHLSPIPVSKGLSSPHPELTDSDDSITSSVLGFFCEICHVRAVSMLTLNEQEFEDEVFLKDLDRDYWVKCDSCNSSYHHTCWETYDEGPIEGRFYCCKYICTACCTLLHLLCFLVMYM